MPYVDRTVFTSNDQSSGEVADPNLLESNDKHVADVVDANYKMLNDFVNSKNVSELGVLNVKEYGAVGDGVTDDAPSIQDAINNAEVGQTVVIPHGDFLCQSTVIVNEKVKITSVGNLVLGGNGFYVLSIQTDSVIVDALNIKNPSEYREDSNDNRSGGIEIVADEVSVINSRLDSLLHPVLVKADGEHKKSLISNNLITNCLGAASETIGDGICVFGSETVITNNIVTCKSGQDARIGINFEGLPVYRSDGLSDDGISTISNNIIIGPFRRAIHVEGLYGVSVTGNSCRGSTWWGIMIACDNVSVVSNFVEMPESAIPSGANTNQVVGILSFSGNQHIINNNVIHVSSANNGWGIHSMSQSVAPHIKNNRISGVSGGLMHGIFNSQSDSCVIEGNQVESGLSTKQGIYVYQASNPIVTRNKTNGNGDRGIKINDSSDIIAEENTSNQNTSHGIEIVNGTGKNKFSRNICENNNANGIYAFDTTSCIFTDNEVEGNAVEGVKVGGSTTITESLRNRGVSPKGENKGSSLFSGDGATTTFQIPHNLYNTPNYVNVIPKSPGADGVQYINVDETNIIVEYGSAPPTGTDNVELFWDASI